DGIEEAMDTEGEQFGMERLLSAIKANHQSSAADVLEGIYRETLDFIGSAPPRDDITLVVIKAEEGASHQGRAGEVGS
ncbi:MAG: SpoIIE family protein phosphatase, partial [Planctomycetes bacterium]|nr:SpoIIE family protein phosphatase [Planctomycetota bacterium]